MAFLASTFPPQNTYSLYPFYILYTPYCTDSFVATLLLPVEYASKIIGFPITNNNSSREAYCNDSSQCMPAPDEMQRIGTTELLV
ncbi:MAG: hypothetical protein EKK37_06470 [Sphingobacteriales bacterium]|nr:MAG: hypothetical protein EKK37_06470 [Sphingobacteriales bacterium]